MTKKRFGIWATNWKRDVIFPSSRWQKSDCGNFQIVPAKTEIIRDTLNPGKKKEKKELIHIYYIATNNIGCDDSVLESEVDVDLLLV